MAGNERKENYRRPYRNPRYKGRNENAAETAEERMAFDYEKYPEIL